MSDDSKNKTLNVNPGEAGRGTPTPSDPALERTIFPAELVDTAIPVRRDLPEAKWTAQAEAPLDATNRYQPREVLGVGGGGEVVLFHDGELQRDVALKRLKREVSGHDSAQRRFLQEARVQGQIEHPAVVPVYDLGVGADGRQFFTMRRINGRTLRDILTDLGNGSKETAARFSRRKLLTAFSSVCMAVHYAHTRGVLHRDLKPENVMFGDFGEVYLLDWGIAKVTGRRDETLEVTPAEAATIDRDAPADDSMTQLGALLGTPAYMAPEQIQGSGALDARTDVYALGVILFEILTLQRRFPGSSVEQLFQKAMDGVVCRPSERAVDVPPELDELVVRATARKPEDRFATALQLVEAIEDFLDGDRDTEQRKKLAARLAQKAAATLDQPGADRSADGRLAAMQEVMRALALDPEQPEARGTLARLLLEAPSELPPEVEADLKRESQRGRLEALRAGFLIYLSWVGCGAFGLLLGVKSWLAFGVTLGFVVACTALSGYMLAKQDTSRPKAIALAVLTFTAIGCFTTWLGPFVLVPVAASSGALLFGLQATREERGVVIFLGVLSATVPFVVELAGLIPPGFEFRDGNLVILPRGVEIHEGITLASLLYMSAAFAFIPAFFVGRIRDSLSGAERKLFLQAWQFNRLARGEKKK